MPKEPQELQARPVKTEQTDLQVLLDLQVRQEPQEKPDQQDLQGQQALTD